LYLLGLAPVVCWAQQKTFTIEGVLTNSAVSGQYVYLVYAGDGSNKLDSTVVTGGKYVLTGEVVRPGMATLYDVSPMRMVSRSARHHAAVFLEPLRFTVTHVDSFSNIQVTGSTANTEYSKLKKELDPLMIKGQALGSEYRKASAEGDSVRVSELEKELNALDHTMKVDVLLGYAKSNPASPIAVFAMQNSVGGEIDPDLIGPVFDHLSAANRGSEDGLAFQKAIEAAKKTSIGQMAPVFTQNDTLGKPVALTAFRGHYVLIDFWASWCGPCRMENPNVVAAYNRFKGKGFQILSVSLDKPDAKEKWMEAIHKDGLQWTHVSDLQFWDNAVAKTYGIKGIPQNFLLDPQGKIVGKGLRGDELEKKLGEIYK